MLTAAFFSCSPVTRQPPLPPQLSGELPQLSACPGVPCSHTASPGAQEALGIWGTELSTEGWTWWGWPGRAADTSLSPLSPSTKADLSPWLGPSHHPTTVVGRTEGLLCDTSPFLSAPTQHSGLGTFCSWASVFPWVRQGAPLCHPLRRGQLSLARFSRTLPGSRPLLGQPTTSSPDATWRTTPLALEWPVCHPPEPLG